MGEVNEVFGFYETDEKRGIWWLNPPTSGPQMRGSLFIGRFFLRGFAEHISKKPGLRFATKQIMMLFIIACSCKLLITKY